MPKILTIRAAVSVAVCLTGATGWGASYNKTLTHTDPTPGSEYIRGVALDSSGNVYLAGRDMGAPTKHWIARVDANGIPSWVRHSGDGFPDAIAQGFVESYGAAIISGRLIVVGETLTATGAAAPMGFISSLDMSNGTILGTAFFQVTTDLAAGFRAVSADPSDGSLAWVVGWTASASEADNGLLVKFSVSGFPAKAVTFQSLDAMFAKASDVFHAIHVTPGAIMLGGAQSAGSTFPWWVRYDKTLTFQQQIGLPPPPGETDGALVGLTMAAGRLYAAFVGASAVVYDTFAVREMNPATGSLLVPQAVLKSNGPALGSDTRFSCGLATSPVNGRILAANFDQIWDLTPDLTIYDTLALPLGWHVDALSFSGNGSFASAGWHETGNQATAAVWIPSSTSGGTSSTIEIDAGAFKIAPNVIELATGGFAGFHARGNPGEAFQVDILDAAGRWVGSVSGACDGSGAALIRFHGGISGKDPGWSDDSLPPGSYLAVADGAGLSFKPKGFVVVMRRVK